MTQRIKERLAKATSEERLLFADRRSALRFLAIFGYTRKSQYSYDTWYHQLDFDRQSFTYFILTPQEDGKIFLQKKEREER